MRKELPKQYDPTQVESQIYQMWLDNGCFKAEPDPGKKPYSIVMPPPNVTGQLHMGHALDSTLQDILTRYKRMEGYSALWLPGTDHAGIATQIKVEEELRVKEGKTRYDLGREKFLERVWAWKEKYGSRIVEQQRKLGVSCDWSRSRFTMDEGCSKAVREAFCEMYDKGLIYKGSRIINWCPHCLTALSDAEVEYVDKPGHLWYIRYPLSDGSGDIVVATTRPETMMGDTGVAVNPNDEKFKHLIGKTCILPIMNREIPIVGDEYCEIGFGTGARGSGYRHNRQRRICQRLPFAGTGRNIIPIVARIGRHYGNCFGSIDQRPAAETEHKIAGFRPGQGILRQDPRTDGRRLAGGQGTGPAVCDPGRGVWLNRKRRIAGSECPAIF